MPEVTVLVAGQESAEAEATVQSLLEQTLEAIEILVLARDDTPTLSIDDPRVRLIRVAAEESLGGALNQGLAVAEGALIARAVPGDLSTSDRMARQAGLLRMAATVAFMGAGWRAVGADGTVSRVVQPPAGDGALRAAMAAGDAIGHPTAVMRREAVLAAGGWRPAFAGREDYDLLLRLMDRSAGACTPEPLVDHVVGEAVADWRVLEQQILSEMAAMAAFDRRQAGRPDYGERLLPVDRALLHRMGVVDEEITEAVITRAMTTAMATGSLGQWRAMREAARLGLQQEGLSASAKSRFAKLWMQSLARRRPTGVGEDG